MSPLAARRLVIGAAAAAAVALAGCGAAGDGAGDRTDPPPPDRLDVTLQAEDAAPFRVALDCAVADVDACSEVLQALGDEEDDETCLPLPATGERILVRGTIDGQDVGAALERRTDCEARLYDRVRAALSP